MQVVPQVMPAGELETVPVPVPDLETSTLKFEVGGGVGVPPPSNFAVTFLAEVIERVHVPRTYASQPVMPANDEPEAAEPNSETVVPIGKVALHWAGQLMPAGSLVTVPEPAPVTATARETSSVAASDSVPRPPGDSERATALNPWAEILPEPSTS